MKEDTENKPVVVQKDAGESFWQPVPANGHVELKVSRGEGEVRFDCGVQSVAPGGYVRVHAHEGHDELIFVHRGEGTAFVGVEAHPMRPGTTLHLRSMERHRFVNNGPEALEFFWVLMPGGLGTFFASIGRARTHGEPAPAPFARPDNVSEIEARTVFARDGGQGPEPGRCA